jgi:hypothetical protein
MARESRFLDLRRIADWLALSACESSRAFAIERTLRRLGSTCVPLLGRAMRAGDERGRLAARDGLALVASLDGGARARVVAELRHRRRREPDDGKLSAIGLLADLGASIRPSGGGSQIRKRCSGARPRRRGAARDRR